MPLSDGEVQQLLHTIGKYNCPLGDKDSKPHSGKMLAFIGDRVGHREPPSVEFTAELLEETSISVGTHEKIAGHFNKQTATPVIPRESSADDEQTITTSNAIIWPTEWLPAVLAEPRISQVWEFLNEKMTDWSSEELKHAEYLFDWCRAGLYAATKSGESSKRSANGVNMDVLEFKTENLTEWEDAELEPTLGPSQSGINPIAAQQGLHQLGLGTPAMQWPMPQQSLAALDTAFLHGVTAGQTAHQTTVPSTSGYSDAQMAQLIGYMGLTSRDRDQVPDIWTKGLDKAKTWVDAQRILNAAMQHLKCREEDVDMFLTKEAAEDLWKLKLASTDIPYVETAHRGITIFSFCGVMQEQETAARLSEGALDAADTTTPADHKAAKARKRAGPPARFGNSWTC